MPAYEGNDLSYLQIASAGIIFWHGVGMACQFSKYFIIMCQAHHYTQTTFISHPQPVYPHFLMSAIIIFWPVGKREGRVGRISMHIFAMDRIVRSWSQFFFHRCHQCLPDIVATVIICAPSAMYSIAAAQGLCNTRYPGICCY